MRWDRAVVRGEGQVHRVSMKTTWKKFVFYQKIRILQLHLLEMFSLIPEKLWPFHYPKLTKIPSRMWQKQAQRPRWSRAQHAEVRSVHLEPPWILSHSSVATCLCPFAFFCCPYFLQIRSPLNTFSLTVTWGLLLQTQVSSSCFQTL